MKLRVAGIAAFLGILYLWVRIGRQSPVEATALALLGMVVGLWVREEWR